MSMFLTWDEVAAYVTQMKGYEYLDNPTSWINAFKEVVGDARYVGDNTYFQPNPTVEWINVGKSISTGLETGVKNPPVVSNIITDTTTGGAVAGAAALATEATGITLTLTVAGYCAAVVAAMGLGVVSLDLFPEFYADLLNNTFGTHLTPEEVDPNLGKTLKAFLTTEDVSITNPNGTIYTYVPTEWLENSYNFLASHISISSVDNTFPSATFNTTTGDCTANPSQATQASVNYVSLSAFQEHVHKVATTLREYGFTNAFAPDITDLYDQLQADYDLSDFDIIQYGVESYRTHREGVYTVIENNWDL